MKNLIQLVVSITFLGLMLCPAQTPDPAPAPDATAATTTTPQPIDPAKMAEITKMLQKTGMLARMNAIASQIFDMFKKQMPGVPPEFWERMTKEIDNQDLLNQLIPLYDKYYSLEDLKAINAFYDTPTGQHMLAASPQIMHDSMLIGQQWGQNLGKKVMEELQKEKASEKAAQPATSPAPSPSGG